MNELGQVDAYKLLHQGSIALGEAERNGMRVDMEYVQRISKELVVREKELQDKVLDTKGGSLWAAKFGTRLKFGGDDQLAWVLFDRKALNLEPVRWLDDEKTKPAMDKDALVGLDAEIVAPVLELRKVNKTLHTYLAQITREVNEDGFIRPFFNLDKVVTFRSSSDSPNFQNIPIRDPEMGELIRRAFIPRDGHVIVEVDYGGLEVRIACCYHKDPRMIHYLETDYDMHREWAAKCFRLPTDEVDKKVRFFAKNCFVFPEFYGDYWKKCARALWESVQPLSTVSGVPMPEHLKEAGFRSLEATMTHPKTKKPIDPDAFETHIHTMERELWDDTFPVYRDWKPTWIDSYREKGYIDLLTGFRIRDVLGDNDIINYPVQGAAFHCLLWSFIQTQNWVKRERMKTCLIGQIHDSIVADVHTTELPKYLQRVNEVMTQDIRREWKWIIIPLEIEAEACKEGETWHDKKVVEIPTA